MMVVYFLLLGSWCYSGWSPLHIGGFHKTFKKRSKRVFLYGGRGVGRASGLGLEETTNPDGLCGKQRSNYIPNDHWHFGLGGRGVALPHLIWDIKVCAGPKANWVWILEGATIFFYFSLRSAIWSVWIRWLEAHATETAYVLQRSSLK